jgi:uncharacterized protein (DUF433 family)
MAARRCGRSPSATIDIDLLLVVARAASLTCYRQSMSTDWRERISVDPDFHHGEACVRGTRVPVRVIVGSLAEGHEPATILRQYPQLRLDDVHAALAYAAEVLQDGAAGDSALGGSCVSN